MSDVTAAGQAIVSSANDAAKSKSTLSKKKTGKTGAAKKHTVDHPKYSEMVHQALGSLKERGGSSRQAVLKYIMKNFKVGNDENVVNTHLKIALRSGVKNASLKQSKGSGATGSFRLGEEAKKKPKKTASTTKTTKKAKTPPAAKIRKTNKTAAGDKSPIKKMTKKATTKSASSVKKSTPAKTTKKPKVAAKPKTDKPKKTTTTAKKVDKPKNTSTKVVKKPVAAKKTSVAKKSAKPAAAKKS